MNDTILLVFLGVILLINVVGIFLMSRKKEDNGGAEKESVQMMNQNLQGMQMRLDKVSDGINERLDNAAKVIGQVNNELGSMKEIGRNMQALQDFLKSPKLRGNIGEQVLKQMLDQYFPSASFQMQYRFAEGQIVDAILRTEDGIVPIDSKFPMENFQRMMKAESEADEAMFRNVFMKDVKKHVNDIAKKYILPDEGTVDFAVMYVPSEAVYYEIIRDDLELNLHGIERKVLFVSPNSFYYFLRVIMMGMQGKKVAEATRHIIAAIHGIQKDAKRFEESLGVLQTHVTHAKAAVERATSDYSKLGDKIERIDDIDETTLLD